jgi:hypothetical protein
MSSSDNLASSGFASPTTTPVQDDFTNSSPSPPPKIWSETPPSANTVEAISGNTWYDLCGLYCKECLYFQFAGNYDTLTKKTSFLPTTFDRIPRNIHQQIIAAAKAAAPSAFCTPSTPSKATLSTPSKTFNKQQDANKASISSNSPSFNLNRRPQVRRSFTICDPPTLCCLPVKSTTSNVPHLKCPNTPISSMSLCAKGCQRCLSNQIQVLQTRVQLAEMQYGAMSIIDLPAEIAHCLLICDTCNAIGFPGCSDRLTVIHEKECVSTSPVHMFYDTISKRGLNATAWSSAFTHLPDCSGKGGVQTLPIRLRKSELKSAYQALHFTTPLNQRPKAMLEQEKKTSECRKQFLKYQNNLVQACTPDKLLKSLVEITNHILLMREIPSEIFDCSALEMRVRTCNMLRGKRKTSPGCWNRDVAHKFGVLLRVFNTLCDEEERTWKEEEKSI